MKCCIGQTLNEMYTCIQLLYLESKSESFAPESIKLKNWIRTLFYEEATWKFRKYKENPITANKEFKNKVETLKQNTTRKEHKEDNTNVQMKLRKKNKKAQHNKWNGKEHLHDVIVLSNVYKSGNQWPEHEYLPRAD